MRADDERWLVLVRDLQLVGLVEVASDTDALVVLEHEEVGAGARLKGNVFDDVVLPLSVVGYHRLANYALPAFLLEPLDDRVMHRLASLVIVVSWQFVADPIVNVVDDIEDCVGRHELVAVVDDKRANIRVLVSTSLEATPNLNLHLLDIDGVLETVELWSLAHLDEASLTHCFLDDDVEDLAHGLAIPPIGFVDLTWINNEFSFPFDEKSDLSTIQL